MRFEKKFKVHKACSNESFRPALCSVRFTGKRLVATDGDILAVVPVISNESDKDTPNNIPAEAIQKAVSGYKKIEAEVYSNGSIEVKNQTKASEQPSWSRFEKVNEKYPAYPRLVVKAKKVAEKPLFKVALNVSMLSRLAEAMGTKTVTLSFDQHDFEECENFLSYQNQISVEPGPKDKRENNESYGLIMPIRLNNNY
jgi:hypothetical protein